MGVDVPMTGANVPGFTLAEPREPHMPLRDPMRAGTWRQKSGARSCRTSPPWEARSTTGQHRDKEPNRPGSHEIPNNKPVHFCTDGACSGNPGPGGWGVALMDADGQRVVRTFSGYEPYTTNQRMEMMAAIQALKMVNDACPVVITTDSQYVKKGITEWIHGWKRKGWRNASGKPVKNRDLWERLDALNGAMKVSWQWVKGHSGHLGNEAADTAAQEASLSGHGVY